mmetsp:Transcript_7971/g.20665  ORF Transcript_7971/g.20665 Transcript_7971/m.20665 type:complete len:139 (+) Transcript_7971:44-460(+)
MGRWFLVGLVLATCRGLVVPTRHRLAILSAAPSDGDTSTLTQGNVELALEAARTDLEALFGYSAENRAVGITGHVDLVEISGPTVVLRLSGRFWHERRVVLDRVGAFLQDRIPELCDWEIESPDQLDDDDAAPEIARF